MTATTIISLVRTSENEVSRTGAEVATLVAKNPEKVVAIVSGLIEKAIAAKVRKLDVGASVSVNLEALLSDLVVSAAGRVTRESLLEYFSSRKEEIAAIFALSRGISEEKLVFLSEESLAKLFALTVALYERVAISAVARESAVGSVVTASLEDLRIIASLPDLPDVFAARIAACIEKQNDLFELL